jgi:anaerobic ribonucleoside-triphosphate reductase
LNQQKRQWLESQSLTDTSNIVDCAPDAGKVTMANGATRQVCERFTRVMGYHRPVHTFNTGKKQEHADRRFFSEL